MSEVNYHDYLDLDNILGSQKPLSENEHDEMLFIIIHQTMELWFKQLLHEGNYLQDLLAENDHQKAYYTLHRMCVILKTMVAQTDILETMTPLSFSSFRTRLGTASGFQSHQFRLFEVFLGKRTDNLLARYAPNSEGYKEIAAAISRPSIYDSVIQFLAKHSDKIPAKLLDRPLDQPYEASEEVEDAIEEIYRAQSDKVPLLERLVDLDEGLQEWRYRHVKMVERTIGSKPGTGGSKGADYLKSTLFSPIFPELWYVRSRF